MKRGELIANAYGDLSVWEWPTAGLQYAVGVDTSSGIRESVREGDPSCACVIEMRTCRQVAEMHAYKDPTMWGWACARLAWLYNEAPLAIETQPSQHGLAAYIAAERYPYPNMWAQSRRESRDGRLVERRGWVRPAGSTGDLFNRIRDAMRENAPIRSVRLLDELSAMRYEEGKFKTDEHDDCILAYGIALMIRDQAFADGEIKAPVARAEDVSDIYWQRELAEATPLASPYRQEEEWNGI